MSILEKIISCKNDGIYRVITVLGIKFKYKNARRQIVAELNALKNECGFLQKEIEKTNNVLKTLSGRTTALWETDYASLRYYENKFEKEFVLPFFDYMDRPDFQEKYLALVRNLSDRDIREINKILSRLNVMKAKPQLTKYNFFSPEEQKEKIKILTDFRQRILSVSEGLYTYGAYKLPINHFEPCVFLYKHGIELVKDKASLRNKDFIDAGAFIGDSALVLSEYTDKRIYSFEANPENIDLFQKTIELNGLTNVTPVQKALYSSETELEFNLSNMTSGASLNRLNGVTYNETIKVQTITLDKYVQENNLDVGLIKVDLEGAEQEFLKGAEQTIKAQKPVLLLSIYHKPSDFFELKPMLESWVPEYEFTIFSPVDMGILLETMIVAQAR
ncbi:MAG: FkbM family methyltransferase [Alphaproteobacteria bacterium]|nr:FkbM family methyltransferase [Alphaproteobacteria bacterium]